MTKRAIGYVRGKKYKKKWTPDCALQRQQIEDYAEAYGYDLIETRIEEQQFHLQQRDNIKVLGDCADYCLMNGTALLYVDLGKWRTNPLISCYLKFIKGVEKRAPLFFKSEGVKKPTAPLLYEMIAIPADQKTIDAIDRQARLEKYGKQVRYKKKPVHTQRLTKQERLDAEYQEAIDSDDPFADLKFEYINPKTKPRPPAKRRISIRRLNNFKHLCEGADSIYGIMIENEGLSPRLIADKLNDGYYLTVEDKRWNRDNVRKVLAFFDDPLFAEFVEAMENSEEADAAEYE